MLNMALKANKPIRIIINYDRDQARHFFMEGGPHFRLICEMAGRNPDYVQTRIRKAITKKGWLER